MCVSDDGLPQTAQELAAKHRGQPLDRDEVGGVPRYPAREVGRNTSSGHDTMDVRVESELLVPGVENGHAAHAGTEICRIGADILKGFVDREKEGLVECVAVGKCKVLQFVAKFFISLARI